MLPTHRSSPSEAGLFKRRLFIPNKLIVRWIGLAVVVITFIWFLGPLLADSLRLGRSEFQYSSSNRMPQPSSSPSVELADLPSRILNLPPPPSQEEQDIWEPRKKEVRDAFSHAWSGYMKMAYPNDELMSLSGGKSNKYNGWGVTIFDSLDTMWIIGLRDEFTEAMNNIKDIEFHATKPNHYAPFFETTIRYLGGVLSAYALSTDSVFLRHAERIADILMPAFNGTETGLPAYSVNVETGEILSDAGGSKKTVLFAEAATCQLEFKYLAKLTGKKEYYENVEKAMDVFYRANVTNGLFHDEWSMKDGTPQGEHFTIGATADSGYEYLLKQWVQSGDLKARQQYIKSANGIINNLVYQTPNRGLLYAGDIVRGSLDHRLEHLSCYLPGVLALGASSLPDSELSPKEREIHRWAAHGLAYTCAISYADQRTGLGPDQMSMSAAGRRWMEVVDEWELGGRQGDTPPGMGEPEPEKDSGKQDYYNFWPNAYFLRPETVESIFIMWRTTGDVQWRERGYAIFKAIEEHTRTDFGYASIHGVNGAVQQLDEMPSWFLAETLKYLYLLFDNTTSLPLDKWVFNTEAHPLPVFSWTEAEQEAFGIES